MSYAKYHINPETGKPGRCVAKFQCRYGEDSVHFPSADDARRAYERAMLREEWKEKQLPKGEVKRLPEGVVKGMSYTLEAGDYFLCDPYILIGTKDQEGWNDVVASIEEQFGWENDVADPSEEQRAAVGALYRGSPLLMIKQWHGQGLLWSAGPIHRLPSEAGLVGTISKSTMEEMGYNLEAATQNRLGMPLSLEKPTRVWRDDNGLTLVGGHALVIHNDLVKDMFVSLDGADGERRGKATAETYERLSKRAKLWKDDPHSLFVRLESKAPPR